jgi:hypothetical protein
MVKVKFEEKHLVSQLLSSSSPSALVSLMARFSYMSDQLATEDKFGD